MQRDEVQKDVLREKQHSATRPRLPNGSTLFFALIIDRWPCYSLINENYIVAASAARSPQK